MRIDFFSVRSQNLRRLMRQHEPVKSVRNNVTRDLNHRTVCRDAIAMPGRSRLVIRLTPSCRGILLPASTGKKENTMDSHEIHQQNRELLHRGLEWYRRVHFKNHPEMNAGEVANQILLIVLAHPETLSALTSRLVRYRNAEGLNDNTALHNWLNARKEYRRKGVRA